MFSFFAPPAQTRNYFHSFRLFKLFTLLFLLTFSFSSTHAEEITYKFTNKTWTATLGANGPTANWSSGKDGAGFSNSGIQVTDAASGANGTSPISFKNISKIVLTYNTNKSKGEGTAEVKIGDNDATSKKWKYSTGNGTTAKYTLIYDYETPQSGKVKITLKTTTNSIYLVSCTITYNPAPVKSDLTTFEFSNATTDIYLTENGSLFEYSGTPQTVNVEPDTYDGTVSYSIDYDNSTLTSDEAEIDSKTGEITIRCASNLDSNKTLLIKASTTGTDSYNAPDDATYTLTVHPASTKTPVNITAFSATKTTLIVGETTTTTVANDQEDWTAAYTYSSSNSAVATVNESGVITAVSKGTATITATLNVSSEDENYRIGDTTSKSVEITVNNPSHTAHFSINGTIDSNNDCTTEEGESITFPADPDDINGKKFVGWYGDEYSHDTKEPAYVTSDVMGTADVIYYAVFANLTPASCTETAISKFSASDVMIIVGKSDNTYYALSNNNGTTAAPTAVQVTISNGEITGTISDHIKWIYSKTNDGFQFQNPETKDYLYCTNTNNGVRVGSNENNIFTIIDNYLNNSATSRYLGIYSKQDWRCYTTKTGTSNIKDQTFTFYKYIARKVSDISTTVKEPATLVSIAITTDPTKTSYVVGETFTPEGMVVTATYSDNSKQEVTNYTYEPNGQLTTANTTVTITYTEENYLKETITRTASLSITVVEKPKHTITFSINRATTTEQVTEGFSVPFPETVNNVKGKVFMGWVNEPLDLTDEEPTYIETATETVGLTDATYYAVFATCKPGDISYIVDKITVSETGAEAGVSSYHDWKNKRVLSNAVYAGNSAGGSKTDPCIQIRSDNSNSGIVSTTSGGKVTKIEVNWKELNDRFLDIYGSNTAYTAASDLYNSSKQGTLLGSLSAKSEASTILEISGDYEYIGLRSRSGAIYLSTIAITWMNEAPDTYSGYCTTVTTGETSIRDDNKDPMSGKYYATYSSIQKFVVPDDVTVAQVVLEENGLIYLKRYKAGNVVAANTGVLLESDNKITTAFVLTAADATDLGVENVLKASGDGITAYDMGKADNPDDYYFYRLTRGTLDEKTVFGFYWKKTDGSAFDLEANKAYMVLPKKPNAQTAPRYVWLDGQTTAIDGLNADTEATVGSDERIYSLDGRRVEGQLKRGIYVKNGKKFIVR